MAASPLSYSTNIAAADMDRDGDSDLIASGAPGKCYILFNSMSGESWEIYQVPQCSAFRQVAAGDIDNDGDIDLAWASINGSIVAWQENLNGAGTMWLRQTIGYVNPGAWGVCLLDANGDDYLDVAVTPGYPQGGVWLYLYAPNGAVKWTPCPVDTTTMEVTGCFEIYAGDIDGDDDPDLLTGSYDSPAGVVLCWFENTSESGDSWEPHPLPLPLGEGVGPLGEAVGYGIHDIDDDGDSDIFGGVYCFSSLNILRWWESVPGGDFIDHCIDDAYPHPGQACCLDVEDSSINCYLVAVSENSAGVRAWIPELFRTGPTQLYSNLLYLNCDPDYSWVEMTDVTPEGTSASIQVRASDNPAAMGDWSDEIYEPCSLDGILDDNASWLQYRVNLQTSDPETTPVLEDVAVFWNPLSNEPGPIPDSHQMLPISPDPAFGPVSAVIGLSSSVAVTLDVFDITGRMVESTSLSEFQPGWHTVLLGEFLPGIYFVRMQAEEFEATERFAVLE
ncbi:MAG: T9SS type A sorting domain-containing protein [Candidatus Fermentibacter sp.]|nr:T9SS type A sorting domain-containing protein [Candidatus Fermentibacter sp.]